MITKTINKVFLISNMYPSKKNIRYGIFVKNFEDGIQKDFVIEKIVMTKKYGNTEKIFAYFILYLKIFFLFIKAKRKDLIYVHFPLHVAPILLPLTIVHKKIILNFHGSDLIFKTKFKKLLSFFLLPMLKKSHIVVPSNYYKKKLTYEFNVPNSKVFVYPSGGINEKIFFQLKKIQSKRFTIGFISNFIEEKGWMLLLDAIKMIEQQKLIDNLEVIMIGDGPDKIKAVSIAAKLKTKITLLTNIEQKKLASYYNKFDVFTFPTYRETESLGLVGLEAMACGVPVIAGKVGGPMGYIKNDYNGYLFNKKDSKDLFDKIMHFYRLPNFDRMKMAQNSIDTASNYESRKVNKELLQFLNSFN